MILIKFIKRFYFALNILASLYALLVYQLVYSAEVKHWLAGFMMMSYPLVLLIHILFFISYVFVRPLKALLSLVTLLIITFSISTRTLKFVPKDVKLKQDFDFSVLSYNMMYGNYFAYKNGNDKLTAKTQKVILDTLSADIVCLQEFYNDKRNPDFNLLKILKRTRPHYVFLDKNTQHTDAQGLVGLAIFSRFPIIAKKEIYWPPNNNGILIADVVFKTDTFRLMNFHMKSMGIRVQKAVNLDKKQLNKNATRSILQKLKGGFEERGIQMGVFEKEIINSPYPIIASGDLNEMPYGYAYGRLSKHLKNAFEKSGFGFGFSYRKILNFLRIDNQFYDDKKFESIYFQTLYEIKTSDHYPIKAWYKLK